jgi:hypothetical protein
MTTHYGSYGGMLTPHGIIILETLMEYSTTNNSQKFPEPVSYLINV